MNYKQLKINGEKIYEHRYVMQLHLGRKLLKGEIVHHEDRDRRNNDISNLRLTTQSQHVKDHHKRNELHKVGYKNSWLYRYNYGKRVIVKDRLGKELFTSLSIKCASQDTGIPLITLWRILLNKSHQRNGFIVNYI